MTSSQRRYAATLQRGLRIPPDVVISRPCSQRVLTFEDGQEGRRGSSKKTHPVGCLTIASSDSESTATATVTTAAKKRSRRAEQARARRRRDRSLRSIEAFLWPLDRPFAVRERKIRDLLQHKPILEVENIFKGTTGAQLTLNDLTRLEGGRWLTGEIINWMIFSIASSVIEKTEQSPYLVYSTDFIRYLMSPHPHQKKTIRHWHWSDEARQKGSGRRFESYKRVLVPFNVGESHWCLALLDVERRVVKVFDSYNQYMTRGTHEMATHLADYARERVSSRDAWIIRTVPNLAQQTNSYDCGVFVCAYVEALLTDQDPLGINTDTVRALRARLLVLALELSVKH